MQLSVYKQHTSMYYLSMYMILDRPIHNIIYIRVHLCANNITNARVCGFTRGARRSQVQNHKQVHYLALVAPYVIVN